MTTTVSVPKPPIVVRAQQDNPILLWVQVKSDIKLLGECKRLNIYAESKKETNVIDIEVNVFNIESDCRPWIEDKILKEGLKFEMSFSPYLISNEEKDRNVGRYDLLNCSIDSQVEIFKAMSWDCKAEGLCYQTESMNSFMDSLSYS